LPGARLQQRWRLQGTQIPAAAAEYYWFCLEHVREYNQAWDYFKGMNPEASKRS